MMPLSYSTYVHKLMFVCYNFVVSDIIALLADRVAPESHNALVVSANSISRHTRKAGV